ncbi:MAG: hypothetical protein AAF485_12240 [Chloroflexota bacterium]
MSKKSNRFEYLHRSDLVNLIMVQSAEIIKLEDTLKKLKTEQPSAPQGGESGTAMDGNKHNGASTR